MADTPGAVPLAVAGELPERDADPVGKGGLVEPLDVATALVVVGAALLSGVVEASTAGVVDAAGVADAGAGTAVAAHAHTSKPADETRRPCSIPHPFRTQPMAALAMAADFDGSHWHFKSWLVHPTEPAASAIQGRWKRSQKFYSVEEGLLRTHCAIRDFGYGISTNILPLDTSNEAHGQNRDEPLHFECGWLGICLERVIGQIQKAIQKAILVYG